MGFDVIDAARASREIKAPIAVNNYKSATSEGNVEKVEAQIQEEIKNGRYLIVHEKPKIISAMGAIPKGNGKIRLIHDCSRPHGSSVNDFWVKEPFAYTSLQDAVDRISPGDYLAKVDLASAFRSCRTNPSNYTYCGLQWTFSGNAGPTFMVDTRLPFGARRSPFVFNELTQAVTRYMSRIGFPNTICYLDDFLCIENSPERCNEAVSTLIQVLRYLGFAINYSKIEGPSQNLTFLGIILDTLAMTLKLSESRIAELKLLLQSTLSKTKISKRDTQRLAGKLQFATQCVYGGKFFLRRLFDAIAKLRCPWHRTRVTSEMKKDIMWWLSCLEPFNGLVQMINPRPSTPIFTDACGEAGGAVWENEFVYARWENWENTPNLHINFKETLAIELGIARWAKQLANKKVIVHSDNQAAVAIVNNGTSKNKVVMSSLRRMFWWSAKYNFRIHCVYHRGVDNTLADGVSRLHEGPNLWKKLPVLPMYTQDIFLQDSGGSSLRSDTSTGASSGSCHAPTLTQQNGRTGITENYICSFVSKWDTPQFQRAHQPCVDMLCTWRIGWLIPRSCNISIS